MTQQEAQAAVRNGSKVTHRYFSADEFIYMQDGTLMDEKGYMLDWFLFWGIRRGEAFQTGWEIIPTKL